MSGEGNGYEIEASRIGSDWPPTKLVRQRFTQVLGSRRKGRRFAKVVKTLPQGVTITVEVGQRVERAR